MRPFNVFETYSKWFRTLNALFLPFALLELVAVGRNMFTLVASMISGIYFTLWFLSLVGESIYRIIKYFVWVKKNKG